MSNNDTWQRVHPASPFVHGWLAIVGLLYIYWQNTDELSFAERFAGDRLLWTLGLAGAALLVVLAFYFLSWYFTRYKLTESHVYVNSGTLFRSQKQARIDKVQGIDIAQPLVARLLGLAELRFDVADSSESVLRLAFLSKADAHALRQLILERANSGTPSEARVLTDPADPNQADPNPATLPLMAKVPIGRLLASLFLQLPIVIGTLACLTMVILWLTGVQGIIAGVLPVLLSFGSWFYKQLNQGWNYTASAMDTGMRISYGLADTRQHSIPAGRVQAICVTAPLLWRLVGWYKVEVNVLGTKNDDADNFQVLPVGDFESVTRIMGILLPDLGVINQREVLATAVSTGYEHGFIGSPPGPSHSPRERGSTKDF
ncbi:PH domain-containing protein [Glutamicibacter sp. M10]|uniref:PH domain-containing protein n=1 Tax=Glutamicibacter sp. M10 TaxID=3023076 RepID=UPI0021C7B53F|nr:PH domain-containing protein [Glutamicibacter sp. M10]UXN32320.1 PH domain-containing protein [Glutamicibacter sp. M10]